jgi:glycosyltransferase involved in cell wall biosynthesis
MKLLICTQSVDLDDPVLGFFHAWISEFARKVDSIEVICLRQGRHDLPPNVRVHSLGKEAGAGRLRRAARFLGLVMRLRYDAVFAHMNPEYVIAGGPWWRLFGKEIGFWYAHGAVTGRLRAATFFADRIFTSTPQGYGLQSTKLHIVGQGIDTARFSPGQTDAPAFSLVSVSRVSRSKDIAMGINVVAMLKSRGMAARLEIVGAPLTESDHTYLRELEQLVKDKDLTEAVSFRGAIANAELPVELRKHRFLINAYQNKSLDKVLLEAMATGVIPVSSNAAYCALIESAHDRRLADLPLCVREGDPEAFAGSIARIAALPASERAGIAEKLRAIVVGEHGISELIERIMSAYRLRV